MTLLQYKRKFLNRRLWDVSPDQTPELESGRINQWGEIEQTTSIEPVKVAWSPQPLAPTAPALIPIPVVPVVITRLFDGFCQRSKRAHDKPILLELQREKVCHSRFKSVNQTFVLVLVQNSDRTRPEQYWVKEGWVEPLVKETYQEVKDQRETDYKTGLYEKFKKKWNK